MIKGFNKEQSLAIETSPDIDVIITAGAGSGKTKTLTQKVFRLVDGGAIKPSELLVLTFTNNAAHEMKERIVKAFGGNKKAQEMLSAHVQTFDSFSQYLVSTNAGVLGISSGISLADESVLGAKKLSLLDEILEEYYRDPIQKPRVLKTLKKLDFRDDANLKKDILAIDAFLSKLTPNKRKDFVEKYDETYFGQGLCDLILSEFEQRAKRDIKSAIRDAYFIERHRCFADDGPMSMAEARSAYEDSVAFNLPIADMVFEDDETNSLVAAILPLFDFRGADFIARCNSFVDDNPDFFARKGKKKGEEEPFREPFKRIRLLFATKANLLSYLKAIPSENAFASATAFKDDIALLLELVGELNRRVWDYKRSTNSFTFSDISTMALSLLTDPRYEDTAKSIRGRFNFIMVDEYQDTNDFQEQFIDALSKVRDDGTRAHLFFVGDAKQSIYAFRNSNVALFRKRQMEYATGEGHIVIPMNTNYRSCPKLLSDINYIFREYMREDHGGIDFTDPAEQLRYDKEVDLYSKPFDNAGIYRIHSVSEKNNDGVACKEWEATAIIEDIKKKVAEGHLVYDRACRGVRPCKYGDFVILMRKKAQFDYYQKRFQEEGIPLNNEISTSLRDINPVILMQSLSGLINAKMNGDFADVKHLFASIARSYAYHYDDSTIFALCFDDAALSEDPLMKRIEGFAEKYKDSQFEEIFLAMVDEFHVVSELYRIGNVQDSISKIDSLHALALSLSNMGEGIREFAKLFRDISKYDLDIKADAVSRSENAVSMMSIHASKGLEQKIVYMPESVNRMSKGGNQGKADIDISERYGILLPDYSIELQEGQVLIPTKSIYTLPYLAYRNSNLAQVELDEHVRLFYVALTRAENAVYLVGDDLHYDEDLFAMMDCVPFYEVIDPDFAEKICKSTAIGDAALSNYEEMCLIKSSLPSFEMPLLQNQENAEMHSLICRRYFTDALNAKISKCKEGIDSAACLHYLEQLEQGVDDDLLARFASHYYFGNPNVGNLNELNAYLSDLQPVDADPEEEDEVGVENKKSFSEDDLREIYKALVGRSLSFFGLKLTKDEIKADEPGNTIKKLAKAVLGSLAYAFDGYKKIYEKSYRSAEYEDKHYAFDYFKVDKTKTGSTISLRKVLVDDTKFDFPVIEAKKASKGLSPEDEEAIRPILERGELLHRYMEIVDLAVKDTSFIKNESDRELIDKALSMPCFQGLENALIYKEYGYFDPELNSNGYIDLLVVRDGAYEIVDYKTSHIEDPEYDDQLKNYARNVARLFNIDQKKIKLTLVSLMRTVSREVIQ
ncbi:MAG: UvrD-helicase domain-containing protein [Bacilli bacterium]|nr:UvrD-helicase domain-containing protein [Bacilli bacterium]